MIDGPAIASMGNKTIRVYRKLYGDDDLYIWFSAIGTAAVTIDLHDAEDALDKMHQMIERGETSRPNHGLKMRFRALFEMFEML